MNTGPFRRRRIGAQPEISGQALQLSVQVLPLADPQVVEELGAAHAAEGGAGQLALAVGEVVPERDESEEVRFGLCEPAVGGVGGLLVVGGAFAGVLDGQGGGDDEDFAGAALLVGFEAATLRRYGLTRRGWKILGVVVGDDLESAERRFFDAWVVGRVPLPAPTPGVGPAAPAPSGPIIGLFPEPGARA